MCIQKGWLHHPSFEKKKKNTFQISYTNCPQVNASVQAAILQRCFLLQCTFLCVFCRRLDRIRRAVSEDRESANPPPPEPNLNIVPGTPPPWDMEPPPSYETVMKSALGNVQHLWPLSPPYYSTQCLCYFSLELDTIPWNLCLKTELYELLKKLVTVCLIYLDKCIFVFKWRPTK